METYIDEPEKKSTRLCIVRGPTLADFGAPRVDGCEVTRRCDQS